MYILPADESLPVTRKNTVMRHVVRKSILPTLESRRDMSKLGNDQVYSNEDISWEIKSILSEVLKLSVDSIDDEKSLIELGLSSLSAVELTEKLNQISIHVLLASDLYEIKSISQLVTLVVEGVRPKGLVNNWLLPLNDAPDHVVKMICFPDLGKLTI
jgi:acyl carrier protein